MDGKDKQDISLGQPDEDQDVQGHRFISAGPDEDPDDEGQDVQTVF